MDYKSVFLQGKNIYLRPLEAEDAQGPYPTWLNNEKVSQGNSHHVFPYTQRSISEYIEMAKSSKNDLILAIACKETNRHIGNISLQSIHWVNRTAEFAILLGATDYWGRGVGKDAGSLILEHGFEALGLNRIHCGTFESNTGMKKLAAFLKMKREGVRRQAVYNSGQFEDVVEFGVLKSEWKQ